MPAMIYTLYGFAIFFFIFWCGKWVIHVLALTYGKYKLHKKTNPISLEVPYPSVSILKPLMGADPNLYSNLQTFFTMDYPQYELLFCVEDPNDPAITVVKRLMQEYPTVDAQLFIGGSNVGVNPKINNMQPGYLAAKYEFIMISDSGIRMKKDTLCDMVHHMTDKVALCHQLPFTADREGFAATFEKIYFGTMQSRIYLVSNLLGIICHTGMSSLMRKNVIDQLGGLQAFGCYLAEDFFIAKRITDAGWKTTLSSQPAIQNSGFCDINSFQARLTRWAKLRVAMVPTLILLEPMAECLVVGLFAAWSVSVLFHWDSLVFYLIHILVWFLSDWILLSIVQNGTLPFNKFDFVVGWLFREISGPYLLFHALKNPEITWRTRIYKLAWGGIAYELSTAAAASLHQKRKSLNHHRFIKTPLPDSPNGIEMQVASDVILRMDNDNDHYHRHQLHDNNNSNSSTTIDHRDHYQQRINGGGGGGGDGVGVDDCEMGFNSSATHTHVPAPSSYCGGGGNNTNNNTIGGGASITGARNLQSLQLHPQYQSSSIDSNSNNLSRSTFSGGGAGSYSYSSHHHHRGHNRSSSNGNFSSYSGSSNHGPGNLNRSNSSSNYYHQNLETGNSFGSNQQQQQQQQPNELITRLHTANNFNNNNNSNNYYHSHHHSGHKKSSSLSTSLSHSS